MALTLVELSLLVLALFVVLVDVAAVLDVVGVVLVC